MKCDHCPLTAKYISEEGALCDRHFTWAMYKGQVDYDAFRYAGWDAAPAKPNKGRRRRGLMDWSGLQYVA